MKLRDYGAFALAASLGVAGCEEENGSIIPDVYVNVPAPKVEIKVPDPMVTVNEADPAQVTVEAPETPEQQPPNVDVNVDVPEQEPPAVDVDVEVPPPQPPVIEVNVPPYEPPTIVVEPGDKEVTVVVQEGDDSCIADFQACADIAVANIAPCNAGEQQEVLLNCAVDFENCSNVVSDAASECWGQDNRCSGQNEPAWFDDVRDPECMDQCEEAYNADLDACDGNEEAEEPNPELLQCLFDVDERKILCRSEASRIFHNCNWEAQDESSRCLPECMSVDEDGNESCITEACADCIRECDRIANEAFGECTTENTIQNQRCDRIAQLEESVCYNSTRRSNGCFSDAEEARRLCKDSCPRQRPEEPEEPENCVPRDCDMEFRPQYLQCSTEQALCLADGFADARELCAQQARTEVEVCRQQRLACQQAQEEEE